MSSSIPLTNAVTSGDEKAVSALLATGADVNETTSGGQSALVLAVIFGHTNVVRLLLEAGADPHLRDNLGLDAIQWAQRRGLTEALSILKHSTESPAPPKIVVPLAEAKPPTPKPETPPDNQVKEPISDAEKSRRWLAGMRQRLDEQALRRLSRNENVQERLPESEERPVSLVVTPSEVASQAESPTHIVSEPEPVTTRPASLVQAPRVLTPPPEQPSKSKRKRCPKCNAIYNGELVSYCAHHIVPLVDADEPIISDPQRSNPPLFWILLVITLTGSIVAGSLITTYLYKSRQAAQNAAAPVIMQKGFPEVGPELEGKVVSLPAAECPAKGPEPLDGVVTVRIMIDQNGEVYWARGSGGDWLMRGAAAEAAMKSTFSPDKLRQRETEGTITYTFKP